MSVEYYHLEHYRMRVVDVGERPTLNQVQYDTEYGEEEKQDNDQLKKVVRKLESTYCYAFTGVQPFLQAVVSFIPIIDWLPKYAWKKDFAADIIGGFTTGIMHVPQGIAYSTLAGVDPVYGLYASCFPAFFYIFFGTSRHVSIGSFAVVALMAGVANDNVMQSIPTENQSLNGTLVEEGFTSIQVATTLTLALGIWQILCGVFRLQFILTYFSDPLVSGFTTGAAVHVLLAQLDDLIGVAVPKASGPGYIFVRIYDLAARVPEANLTAVVISIFSMSFLYIGKEYFSPYLSRKVGLKMPIPYELILVAVTAALSSILSWTDQNGVFVVGNIPAGIPEPQLPSQQIFKSCFVQSAGIAVVTIAVHVSMAKMLAKKFDYKIDANQELYALGLAGVLGSMFPIYPVSTALGRTMVSVKSGSRTQLSTVFSCALLLSIILWLGPLLQSLPKCVLASIITIALQSMFRKFSLLKKLWPVSKADFCVWLVAFLATALIDVMEGLLLAIIFTLMTVIFRTQWPSSHHMTQSTDSHGKTDDGCNFILLRFDAPLLFTNVERFRSSCSRAVAQSQAGNSISADESMSRPTNLFKSKTVFFIIDFSSICFMDYMGATVLQEISKDLQNSGFTLYIAAANADVRRVMCSSGFYDVVSREHQFPTIHDAISIAKRNENALQMLTTAKKEQVARLASADSPTPMRKSPLNRGHISPILRISPK